MTNREKKLKAALDLAVSRLAIACSVFEGMEHDAIVANDLESASTYESLREMLIGKHESAFDEIRNGLYENKVNYQKAKNKTMAMLRERAKSE